MVAQHSTQSRARAWAAQSRNATFWHPNDVEGVGVSTTCIVYLHKCISVESGVHLSSSKLCLCGMASTTAGEAVALRAELYAARRSAGALQKDLDAVRSLAGYLPRSCRPASCNVMCQGKSSCARYRSQQSGIACWMGPRQQPVGMRVSDLQQVSMQTCLLTCWSRVLIAERRRAPNAESQPW